MIHPLKHRVLFVLLVLLMLSCRKEKEEPLSLFSLLRSSQTGVDFVNNLTEDEESNMIDYLYFNNGGGVAAGDINNDGLTDLYFTSNQESNRLYLNLGNMQFRDITGSAGVAGTGTWTSGVTMADVNGDNYLDIYVCQVGSYKNMEGRNLLYINRGDGSFVEEAEKYGLDFEGFSTQAAFFDYDIDGDLDMYLVNHSVHTSRSYGGTYLRNEKDERAGDRLYRNEGSAGDCRFMDVTAEAGIFSSQIGYGLAVSISDINNDGAPDIYVSNDFHEDDYLYINQGDGSFRESLRDMIGHTSRSSMGNDVADLNNDGLPDIVVLDMLPDDQKIRKQSGGDDDYRVYRIKRDFGYYEQVVRNVLQLNMGASSFSEIGRLSGICSTDWSWSPLICDMDNDGWKDLSVTNGIYRRANDLDYIHFLAAWNRKYGAPGNAPGVPDRELYERMPLHPAVNYLFRNKGDLTFNNMAPCWGMENPSYSNGAAYADLDNDGDLDLAVNNINAPAFIYRNNADTLLENHYLSFRLKGTGMNTRAVGARVSLHGEGMIMMVEQFSTRGFFSSVPDVLHLGTGGMSRMDSVVVRWPDGSTEVLRDVHTDQKLILEMDKGTNRQKYADAPGQKVFSVADIKGLGFMHRENAYVDLTREGLIPHNLSAEGPALAVGDVNGDGLEDLFVGGADGQNSLLFIQESGGAFSSRTIAALATERQAEDVDAVFFDADGDGDQDLYLVRGGNQVPAGNVQLADRLLLNDGRGVFVSCMEDALPAINTNGSCVRPADYDGDGDMDLFIGSRSLPGAYGHSPVHFLLENDGKGNFRNVYDRRMMNPDALAMVTGACWTDVDGDGDPDLVVAGEWMPLILLENRGGAFIDVSEEWGLAASSGWWNCVVAGDVDGDGDMDLVGGNLGLNSMLRASPDEPVEMYVADFDNSGSIDQLICSYHDGISYPVASLDQLTSQLPVLREKFPHYADYGGLTAEEVLGQEQIDMAQTLKADLFESCLFRNNGKGGFDIEPLPVEAQFSPVRDILIRDMNGDDLPDMVLVGNNYSVRPSYGRQDASFGWYLEADSVKNYRVLWPGQGGMRLRGDARRIISLEVDGKEYLVAGINDDSLRVIRCPDANVAPR